MTGAVLAVDQGTSGTKALVVCPERGVIGTGFAEVHPRHLSGGLVEVDPEELYRSVLDAGRQALSDAREPVGAPPTSLRQWGRPVGVPVTVDPPLRWIAPNRVTPTDRHRYVLRTTTLLTRPLLRITQDGRTPHHQRLRTAVPNRTLTLTARWNDRVDPTGGPVRVSVR